MRTKCKNCNVPFNESQQSKGFRSLCKSCYSDYMKAYYKNNSDKYDAHKEYVSANDAIWNDRVSFEMARRFSKGCMDCGVMNPVVLEFDHRDPSQKVFRISDLRKRKTSWENVIKELGKCDVVCANCHRIRTALVFGSWKSDII